jgi:phosphoribosylaminoimidazole-succinocarboxamide synthase
MDKLIEGKTKIIYDAGDGTAHMVAKDDITAGDGEKHDVIKGKAELATRTTANVFELLNHHGIRTHFIGRVNERTLLCKRCEMIPRHRLLSQTQSASPGGSGLHSTSSC